jgi:hypothetical protein
VTSLTPPPEDPSQRRRWARGVLRTFSRASNRDAVGASDIRSLARQILKELDRPSPAPPPPEEPPPT